MIMNGINDYMDYLTNLTEEQLRQVVLIPLFRRMGFKSVIEYHGTVEKGKDIICYYTDPSGEKHNLAAVVKRTNIHGAVGKKGSAGEILIQTEQSFNEPYTDIYNLKELVIDECWIVTSGEIKNTAIESIRGKLRKSNLDKFLRFIDGEKIVTLINEYMPEFWEGDRYFRILLHEMRSPIMSIRAYAELLEHYISEGKLDTETVKKVAADIRDTAKSLDALAYRSYFFGTRDIDLKMSPVSFDRFIRSVLLQFSRTLRRPGSQQVELDMKGIKITNSVEIDKRAFGNALECLLDNAGKFAKPDRPIELIVSYNGAEIIIRVRDYGIGVPKDMEERIFQPFFRTEKSTRISPVGIGIGLTVARKIVRQHGGELRLTRNADPTEFSIYLPYEDKSNDSNRR